MRLPRRGFTLIEMLVVIAVIALVISILIPGLAKARETARSMRELASISQLAKINATYSLDFKDEVIPVRIPKYWIWWNICDPAMYPPDPADPGRARISHESMRNWTWRLMGYASMPMEGTLLIDKNEIATLRARGYEGRSNYSGNLFTYPDTSFVAGAATHPAFGMNGVFVGGDTNHSAFKQYGTSKCGNNSVIPGRNPRTSGGLFYVTKTSDARRPADLITFAASRAGDVSGTSYHGNGGSDASNLNNRRDGFYKVLPPTSIPSSDPDHGSTYTMMPGWTGSSTTRWNPRVMQSGFGYLNARYFNTVAVTRFDASGVRMSIEQLRNMKYWDNYAPENTNPTTGVYTWRPR
ncbi:MAG: type II secretion system protein [Phycisphaerae bacterium]|nr:type II secretion system protein [Phycisphaerae bacterium]